VGGQRRGRRPSGRNTTSGYNQLDVRRLQRDGLLKAGPSFVWQWSRAGKSIGSINVKTDSERVTLQYRNRPTAEDEWQSVECPVRLEWTECNYGGKRAWFLCPGACGRRVAILYYAQNFACRKCHHLAYDSQHEDADRRAVRKAQTIRIKLGGSGSLSERFPWKPKGMHWQTYEDLFDRADAAYRRSWSHLLQR
jgi:hypothetical protein